MATFTPNYNLKKPDVIDFINIMDINGNMDILDDLLKTLSEAQKDIDCGIWDSDPIAEHNAAAAAHQNLTVDGNNTAAVDSSQTLEEHMANPNAHQNLIVDGNNT